MTFPFYILIAAVVFYCRYRHLTGGFLKKGPKPEGGDCLTPSYRGPAYYAYGAGYSDAHDTYVESSYFGLKLDGTIPFIIKPINPYHRILMRCGLARGLKTGFQDIDRKLFIMTDDPEQCSTLFQDQEFRQNVADLFNLPVKTLYSLENRIWIKATHKMFEHRNSMAAAYRQRMACLRKIRDRIQESGVQAPKSTSASAGKRALCMISLHSALFVAGLLTFILVATNLKTWFQTSTFSPQIVEMGAFIELSGLVGLGVAAAWLAYIVRSFSRKSWFGWVIADFMVFGLIGIILTSGYLLREANIRLDFTQPETIQRPVVDRVCLMYCDETRKGRDAGKTYALKPEECAYLDETISRYKAKDWQCGHDHHFSFYIDFPAIADNQWPQLFRVWTDQKTYLATERGMMLSIPVHRGLFGIQWTNTKDVGKPLAE